MDDPTRTSADQAPSEPTALSAESPDSARSAGSPGPDASAAGTSEPSEPDTAGSPDEPGTPDADDSAAASAGRRRGHVVIGIVAALVLIGFVVWSSWPRSADDPLSRDQWKLRSHQVPGVPVMLPLDVPSGYKPGTDLTWRTDSEGRARTRTVRFEPVYAEDREPATVCVAAVSDPSDPCGTAPAARRIDRTYGTQQVRVILARPDVVSRMVWEKAVFTDDLDQVTWLH